MKLLAAAFLMLTLAGPVLAQPPAAPPAGGPILSATGVNVDPDYILGATDKVRIIVYNEPNLSGEFVISGAGVIAFPLIGDVRATGLSVPALQEEIRAGLSNGYLRDPKVSIQVLTFRPFYILGEVAKPGEYPYTNGLTVMNAVATAGGFSYRAEKKRVFIRHADQTAETLTTLTASTPVQPGDTIRVRERYF